MYNISLYTYRFVLHCLERDCKILYYMPFTLYYDMCNHTIQKKKILALTRNSYCFFERWKRFKRSLYP